MDRLLEATYHAEQRHFWFRGLARFLAPLIDEALEGVARPEILDAGCGTGRTMRQLGSRGRVTGVDLTPTGLAFAHASGLTRLARATVAQLPFPDATFDLVTSIDVLYSIEHGVRERALREMHRVLRPGGAFIANTAALPWLRGQHSLFALEVHRHTRAELAAELRAAGFEVHRITYTNFTLLPIVASVRLAQRLFGLTSSEDSGADIHPPPAPVNAVLTGLLHLESQALRVVDMPAGSSLMTLARRRP